MESLRFFWLLFEIIKKSWQFQTNSNKYWRFQRIWDIISMESLRFFGYCLGSPKKLAIPNKFHQILAIPKRLRHNLQGITKIFWLLFGIAKKSLQFQTNYIIYWRFQTVLDIIFMESPRFFGYCLVSPKKAGDSKQISLNIGDSKKFKT